MRAPFARGSHDELRPGKSRPRVFTDHKQARASVLEPETVALIDVYPDAQAKVTASPRPPRFGHASRATARTRTGREREASARSHSATAPSDGVQLPVQ